MPRYLICTLALVLTLPISLFAQNEETKEGVRIDPDNPVYSWHEDHDRNGTGKFYMGREIARVMSYHGAPWLERPEREREEKLSLLIDVLKLKTRHDRRRSWCGFGAYFILDGTQSEPWRRDSRRRYSRRDAGVDRKESGRNGHH